MLEVILIAGCVVLVAGVVVLIAVEFFKVADEIDRNRGE